MSQHPALIVPRRFCGPPSSGNGGWTAGALAALVEPATSGSSARAWPAIRVSLRKPPPLDTPMEVVDDRGGVTASAAGVLVASAELADADLTPVEPVGAAEARAAMATYPGLTSHPFPTCFACGTTREEGDGLRIFPGRVSDQDGAARIAATWTPHPSVAQDPDSGSGSGRDGDRAEAPRASLASTWAALDCIGGWAGDMNERLMVLGRMTARVDALPVLGEEHVVVGLARGQEGRKTFTASTLYEADGRVVACAEHVWIAVDPEAFA